MTSFDISNSESFIKSQVCNSAMARLIATAAFAALVATSNAISPAIFKALSSTRASTGSVYSITPSNGPFDVFIDFDSTGCNGTPWWISVRYTGCVVEEPDKCDTDVTYAARGNPEDEVSYSSTGQKCVTDSKAFAKEVFSNQTYLNFDYYADTECTQFYESVYFAVDDKCHPDYIEVVNYTDTTSESFPKSFRANVNANGSITYVFYGASADCSDDSTSLYLVPKEHLSSKSCQDSTITSTNMDLSSHNSDTSHGGKAAVGSSVGLILVIVAAGLIV